MVPLILLLRLVLGLLSIVLRPRQGTAPAQSPFRLGDVVRVGVDTRRWRVAEIHSPNGLGLQALDADRFIVLNHTQLSRLTRVRRD